MKFFCAARMPVAAGRAVEHRRNRRGDCLAILYGVQNRGSSRCNVPPKPPRTMVTEYEMDLIAKLEQEEVARLTANKTIPEFAPGDTVVVNVNVVEGTRKRVQAYEGVVIARRHRGLNSSFIVRKISSGEGVERTFQLYSPAIASIEVKRRGAVRRAKLYYLRDRSGKSARIREKIQGGKSGD